MIQYDIFSNNIFRICINPRYEHNVLILTIKIEIEEIRCTWNILYQMPLWNSFRYMCCCTEDQLLLLNLYLL